MEKVGEFLYIESPSNLLININKIKTVSIEQINIDDNQSFWVTIKLLEGEKIIASIEYTMKTANEQVVQIRDLLRPVILVKKEEEQK